MKPRIFFSYSHKDETYLESLRLHFAILRNSGRIHEWTDRELLPGADFDDEIREELEKADIILLLVSPHFLASSYCQNVEMHRALQRRKNEGVHVVPIILDYCGWKKTELRRYKALPKDGVPVVTFSIPNLAYFQISEGLDSIVESLEKQRNDSGKTEENTHISNLESSASHYDTFIQTTRLPPIFDSPPQSSFRPPSSFSINDFDQIEQTRILPKSRSVPLGTSIPLTDFGQNEFLKDCFINFVYHFRECLKQLELLPGITTVFEVLSDRRFTCEVFRQGKRSSACTIWRNSELGDGLFYTEGVTDRSDTFQRLLTADTSDGRLVLRDKMEIGRTPSFGDYKSAAKSWSDLLLAKAGL